MGEWALSHNVRHRVHGKMHKSMDVFLLQERLGGACGVCCQKVSEAEAFARSGVKDILISNQIRNHAKIDRLARIPKVYGSRIICCIDDIENVADLSNAAYRYGTQIECLIELDNGAGRCGITSLSVLTEIAKTIESAECLKFSGIQAYHGALQHIDKFEERQKKFEASLQMVKDAVRALKTIGLDCDIVGGGG